MIFSVLALRGPEGKTSKEGQFVEQFIVPAKIPKGSDIEDSVLCPAHPGATKRSTGFLDTFAQSMGLRL